MYKVVKRTQRFQCFISCLKGFVFALLASSSFGLLSDQVEQADLPTLGMRDGQSTSKPNTKGLTAAQARQKLQDDIDRIKSEITAQLCIDEKEKAPCSVLPMDNTDFSEFFVYVFLTESGQNSFDVFSWQTFIALNWPIDVVNGAPAQTLNAPDTYPRPWFSYKTRKEVLGGESRSNVCEALKEADAETPNAPSSIILSRNFLQTSGKPLIDRDGNYVLYDVRVNQEMSDYIESNGLDTEVGQSTFFAAGNELNFPRGHFDDPDAKSGGSEGSIAIKTAWRILPDDSVQKNEYFTVNGRIPVNSDASASGEAFCLNVNLGLVGMHIMRRTESGNGDKWIWSTFEHVDNAPLAANYRRPNDVVHKEPFAEGCKAPDNVDRDYAFFSDDCEHCPTNEHAGSDWLWSPRTPHAVNATGIAHSPTQVVRCWEIFEGTQLINSVWRQNLAGTVWANYQSTSAQWVGSKPNSVALHGEVPKFMSNTTMETYEQDKPIGSCIGCHAASRTATGHKSNELFLLSLKSRF